MIDMKIYDESKENSYNLIKGSPKLTGYASIDKPWLKYYPIGIDKTIVPDESIYQFFEPRAKAFNNFTAMRYVVDNNDFTISYKTYLKRINDTAKALIKLGIKKNEKVLFCLPNVPEARILLYAINLVGATYYPVTPMIPPKLLEKIIHDNDIKNIFIFNLFYQKYKNEITNSNINNAIVTNGTESIPDILINMQKVSNMLSRKNSSILDIPYSDKNISWKEFLSLKKEFNGNIKPFYDKNLVAAIIGTSGTTGTPKGVCLSDKNLTSMALQHILGDLNYKEGDKILDVLITSIGYGLSVAIYSSCCGVESILIPKITSSILPYFEKYHPDHFVGGPIHYKSIRNEVENNNYKLPYGKNMVSGGASLNKNDERFLNKVNEGYVENGYNDKIFVRQGLGATECGGALSYAKYGTYKFGGVGIPLPFNTVSIFTPGTDDELKYNEEGEICLTGPTVMLKYLDNEEETKKVLKQHQDGKIWLHTGDIGYMDEDGEIYIKDRIKNIFMRAGFNVHPSKVQDFICSLSNVSSCRVLGVDNDREVVVPVAFVVLKNKKIEEETINIIFESCDKNLEEPSVPYEIIIMDELPYNIGGKIDDTKLLDFYKNNHRSNSNVRKLAILS